MRITRIMILLAVMLGVILTPAHISTAQASDAPYLYYESPLQHAMIVERADGTDARLLGGVVMPQGHRLVIGPQFSADGQWVAWTSRGDSAGDSKLYVVRVDGTAQISRVENLNRVIRLEWSPVYDYLAVIRSTRAGNSSGAEDEYEILLVDTQFGDIITRRVQTAYAIEQAVWSADGATFSVYYSVRAGQDYSLPLKYKRLDMVLDDAFSRTDVTPEACEAPLFAFPHDPMLASIDLPAHQLVLEDGSGDDPHRVDLPPGYFQSLQWSPDGQHMVVWMRDECATESNPNYHVWYYHMGDETFESLISPVALDTSSGMGLWSPDSQFAAFAGMDNTTYVVSPAPPASTTYIPMPPDISSIDAMFQWSADHTLYVQSSFVSKGLYELPSGAMEFTKTADLPDRPNTVYFSADHQFMTYAADCVEAGEGVVGSACVIDRANDTTAVIYPHSASGFLGYGFKEVYWHPTDHDWLLIVNGGGAGGGEQFIQVAAGNGSLRRELSTCRYTDCYGWLPDKVTADTIPPYEAPPTIPALTLTGMQDFILKAEWSPAGTQIAVSSLDGSTYLFDVTSGKLQYTVPGHTFDWSPDGVTLAVIERTVVDESASWDFLPGDGPITIYGAASGEPITTIEGNYFTVDYSPDGQYLAAGNHAGEVSIIEVANGTTVYSTKFSAGVAAVAFSPDGQQLAIGGVGKEIWAWAYATNDAPQVYSHNGTDVYLYGFFALNWHPDGSKILAAGGPSIFFFGYYSVLFDLTSGETILLDEASYSTFTADGQYRAHINEYNGLVRIVAMEDGETALRLYATGWWLHFNPPMSQLLVASPYVVTIWQLP